MRTARADRRSTCTPTGAFAAPAAPAWLSASILGLGIWLVGVTAIIVPVVAGVICLRRLRCYGVRWRKGQEVVSALAAARGIGLRIDVLLDETVAGPMKGARP